MKCYYNDHLGDELRCKNEATHDEYWCCEEHKIAWQEENYGKKKEKLSISTIQDVLKSRGKEQAK